MALKHLGPRFDVHTGGIDNVFPHHEDEIAQSAPIVGGPPARVWVHGEFLQVGGQKMAKSAGNIERIADVAERGVDPLAFRYLALTSRYRHKLEYTPESLAAAAAGLESLRERLRRSGEPPADGPWAGPAATPRGRRAATGRSGPPTGVARPRRRDGRPPDRPGPRSRVPALRRRARPSTTGSSTRSTTTSTCRRRSRSSARRSARRSADDERRWLALDADFVLGPGPRPDVVDAARGSRRNGIPPRSSPCSTSGRRPAPPRTSPVPTSSGPDSPAEGWEVVDGPDGSVVRRAT